MDDTVTKKHIVGIDFLRFFAACLVMAFHYCFVMGIEPTGQIGLASKGGVAFPELYDYSQFGWVGVQIFFVISGFVIAFSGEKASAFSFFRSRVVRLGPGVWICAPLTLVATLLVGYLPVEEAARGFRHSMGFVPWKPWIDGCYWTLGIEISFYSTVFALILLDKFRHIRLMAIIIGLMSTFFWVWMAVTRSLYGAEVAHMLRELEDSRALRLMLVQYGLFFAIGVLLWSELTKKHDAKNVGWIALFAAGGCVQVVFTGRWSNDLFGTAYEPYIACALFLASIAFIIWSVKFNSVMHSLPKPVVGAIKTAGMMTFPLYLLHSVIGGAMMGAMVRHGLNRWAALSATVTSILLLTWFIAKFAEPRLQSVTRRAITTVYDRYRSMRLKFAK